MTAIGVNRIFYSTTVEPAPSRFLFPDLYAEWAGRADAWAEVNR